MAFEPLVTTRNNAHRALLVVSCTFVEPCEGSLDWQNDKLFHSHLHFTDKKVGAREIESDETTPNERAMLDGFIVVIKGKRVPECSAQDNLKLLAMGFAEIQSSEENAKCNSAK